MTLWSNTFSFLSFWPWFPSIIFLLVLSLIGFSSILHLKLTHITKSKYLFGLLPLWSLLSFVLPFHISKQLNSKLYIFWPSNQRICFIHGTNDVTGHNLPQNGMTIDFKITPSSTSKRWFNNKQTNPVKGFTVLHSFPI